jgi:hypothetical protein
MRDTGTSSYPSPAVTEGSEAPCHARQGTAPTTAMIHIALTEELDGTNTDWLEKVSDEQYGQ